MSDKLNSFAAPATCRCYASYDDGAWTSYTQGCTLHGMCESCGDNLGACFDPAPLTTDKRKYWICAECRDCCKTCWEVPCTCVAPSAEPEPDLDRCTECRNDFPEEDLVGGECPECRERERDTRTVYCTHRAGKKCAECDVNADLADGFVHHAGEDGL
jgi:hypothetical protein